MQKAISNKVSTIYPEQMKQYSFFFFLIWASLSVAAQIPQEKLVKIVVAPDHDDWTYKVGEKVRFSITVLQYGHPVKNIKVRYETGPEKMEPVQKKEMVLQKGTALIDGGTLQEPGFLRCVVVAEVEGKEYRNMATAGFAPYSIKPVAENPDDFDAFWKSALEEQSKVPVDSRMLLLPERCTENVNVYQVSLQHFRAGARLYGILCIPKKEGKYGAVLRLPGAGVRPYNGDIANAEKGMITLEIGIHGIPVTLEQDVYDNLSSGALSGYMFFNLHDRDKFYYKRVFLGCVRANDFLTSLPQYDGENLAVRGGSQGGALSIVTAALDPRVKYLISYATALCDLSGFLYGRAGGWPHYFSKGDLASVNTKEKRNALSYYDVVNFARRLKIPGFYTWGFNDEATPPTTMFAAYNVISAPKELYLPVDAGHWRYPEQDEKMDTWLLKQLKLVN